MAATHSRRLPGGKGWAGSDLYLPLQLREDFVTDGTSGASRHGRTSREPKDLWNIPGLQKVLVLWQFCPVFVIHFYLPDTGTHLWDGLGKLAKIKSDFSASQLWDLGPITCLSETPVSLAVQWGQ